MLVFHTLLYWFLPFSLFILMALLPCKMLALEHTLCWYSTGFCAESFPFLCVSFLFFCMLAEPLLMARLACQMLTLDHTLSWYPRRFCVGSIICLAYTNYLVSM